MSESSKGPSKRIVVHFDVQDPDNPAIYTPRQLRENGQQLVQRFSPGGMKKSLSKSLFKLGLKSGHGEIFDAYKYTLSVYNSGDDVCLLGNYSDTHVPSRALSLAHALASGCPPEEWKIKSGRQIPIKLLVDYVHAHLSPGTLNPTSYLTDGNPLAENTIIVTTDSNSESDQLTYTSRNQEGEVCRKEQWRIPYLDFDDPDQWNLPVRQLCISHLTRFMLDWDPGWLRDAALFDNSAIDLRILRPENPLEDEGRDPHRPSIAAIRYELGCYKGMIQDFRSGLRELQWYIWVAIYE
ncbi:hypothetical protein RhiJN_16380 [Ceratobasidium sp. AG-Ba]|nr:hypothetical protein RhiJN_16380 [Ceratobasidium sp. AG-Ba]